MAAGCATTWTCSGFTAASWSDEWFTSLGRDGASIYLCKGAQGAHRFRVLDRCGGRRGLIHHKLKAKGARILQEPVNFPWALELRVADLDGQHPAPRLRLEAGPAVRRSPALIPTPGLPFQNYLTIVRQWTPSPRSAASNRAVTHHIGALEAGFLGRERSRGASRLLYEIGAAPRDPQVSVPGCGPDSGDTRAGSSEPSNPKPPSTPVRCPAMPGYGAPSSRRRVEKVADPRPALRPGGRGDPRTLERESAGRPHHRHGDRRAAAARQRRDARSREPGQPSREILPHSILRRTRHPGPSRFDPTLVSRPRRPS